MLAPKPRIFRKNRPKASNREWVFARQMSSSIPKIELVDEGYEKFIKRFKNMLGRKDHLGTAKGIEMNIKTTGPPIRQCAYRLPLIKRQAVAKEVEALLQKQIIRPSSSEWAFPVVIVP